MVREVIEELSSSLKTMVKGYRAMSLWDLNTAEIVFSESLDTSFDIDLVTACNLEVIKSKLNALAILGKEAELNNITINLDSEVHIIDIADNRKYFIYLAIDGDDVHVDLAKQLLAVHKPKLDKTINKVLVY